MTQSIASLLRSTLNATSGPRLRRNSQLLPLEQRFMFDGAAVADAAHAAQTPDAAAAAAPALPPAVTVREAEPAKDNGKKEVVLVDTSLADYKSLEAGVRDGVGIVEFDGSRDGLAQIAQWASTQSGLDAIHILSHGSEGTLNLGTSHLTQNSLADTTTQAELAQLGSALNGDGDLLLYGCDTGDSAALLNGLAQATGADVAASTDLTGAARLGGDWTLEARVGDVQTRELDLAQYEGVLDTVTFTGNEAPYDYAPATITKLVGNNVAITFYAESMGFESGLYPYTNVTSDTRLVITAQAGYSFDLSSFRVVQSGYDGQTVSFTGTKANGTADVNGNGTVFNGSTGTTFSGGAWASLNDVKQVVIYSNDYISLQDFNITDIKPIVAPDTATLSDDTGTSNSDFITSTAAQTISGTLTANLGVGQRVEVSYNNGTNWTDATQYSVGSSAWSTTTTLAGSNTFQVRVAGQDATNVAYTHTYTLDTAAPTIAFSSITLSADTGVSTSDLVTKTAAQTITATLSGALAAGDVVWGSVDSGNTWTDVTSKVSGTSLTWTGATLSGTDGSSIKLRVTDAAGNDGASSTRSYTLDTALPTTSVATAAFSNDGGTSQTDFVTNAASQTVSGTLSAPLLSGESVYVSIDNGTTWTRATTTVGQDTWMVARTLASSSTLKVKVQDTAGNDGTVLSQAYIYDTTAPSTTFSGLRLSADTGPSNSDFITDTAAQTISATLSGALAAGDVLYGSLDNGNSWTDITSKVSGTTLTWANATLAGSNTLQLKVLDVAGNAGPVRTQAYVVDTSPPATPATPDLATASDTGPSGTDNITADSTPTLTGSAENGATVDIYDGATKLGSVIAGAGGWTYTSGALSEGSHSITVTATDTAGNVSAASAPLTLTIDTVAPTVTSVAVPANSTYSGGDTLDFTVNFNEAVTVDVSGGAPRIALTVGVTTRYAEYVSGSGSSALTFRYVVQSGDTDANGITVGALSVNGGTLRDTAGNDATTTLNSVGSTSAVNVDGSNPTITGVSASTADGTYGAGQTVTIAVDFSNAVIVDTTQGVPRLALSSGGSATYSGGSGSSTLVFTYTVAAGQDSADLDYTSSAALSLDGATITDAGGSHQNAALTLSAPGTAGSLSANKDLVIDTSAPTNTVDHAAFSADTGSSGSDFITKTAAQTVSGTLAANLAAGESVYVSLDNGQTWALATASTGSKNWSLAGQTLTGSGTLKVRVTDEAGNNGAAYSQAYALDTTAPTISFSGIALSSDTGTSDADLITHTAAQTISATLSAAPAAGDVVYGSLDNGATWTDITSKVSGTTLTWTGVTLAGSNTLRLRVTDAAGNNGNATAVGYVLDTSAPTTSVASAAFSQDSGASSSDFITNVANQTLSGTLSANLLAGESVLISLDNGSTWATASATAGSSSWSLAALTLTSSGTLQVKVVDTAGNDGAVLSQSYIYDTAASVPTVDSQQTGSVTPVLTGTAALAAGETLTVTVGGATYDVTPVAGAWSLDLATAVPQSGALSLTLNALYDVTATVTDLAGNVASDVTGGELLIGTLPLPPAPVEGFQTPPVRPEPLPPIAYPVSLLPPPPPVGEQSSPPPAFDFGSGSSWQSPSLLSDALQPNAGLGGGLAALLAPGAGKFGGREGLGVGQQLDTLTATSGEPLTKQIDTQAFMGNMPGQNVVLSADLADGSPLPGWLKFNARDGRFEGTPPPGFSGKLIVRVTARDGLGHEATQQFEIVIASNPQAQQASPAEHPGRSGLSQQLREARHVGAGRLAGLAAAGSPVL